MRLNGVAARSLGGVKLTGHECQSRGGANGLFQICHPASGGANSDLETVSGFFEVKCA